MKDTPAPTLSPAMPELVSVFRRIGLVSFGGPAAVIALASGIALVWFRANMLAVLAGAAIAGMVWVGLT